jgi:hypothetical protein
MVFCSCLRETNEKHPHNRTFIHTSMHPSSIATRHLFFADLLNSFGSISRFRFAITGFALATAMTEGGGGALAVAAAATADVEPDKLDCA